MPRRSSKDRLVSADSSGLCSDNAWTANLPSELDGLQIFAEICSPIDGQVRLLQIRVGPIMPSTHPQARQTSPGPPLATHVHGTGLERQRETERQRRHSRFDRARRQ